jgi:hypothetical protein
MNNKKETTSVTVNGIDMNLKINIKSYCVQNNISFRDFIIQALKNELIKKTTKNETE